MMRLPNVVESIKALMARTGYKYSPLPGPATTAPAATARPSLPWPDKRSFLRLSLVAMSLGVIAYLVVAFIRVTGAISTGKPPVPPGCDSPDDGFQCNRSISHFWGQYSPYFSVPSPIDAAVPPGCSVDFVQLLARHGGRFPTAGKTALYDATVKRIQAAVTSYGDGFGFIRDYEYSLGADELTGFGQREMVFLGMSFYDRYRGLARTVTPFVRSAGSHRVAVSAHNWTQGFQLARAADDGDGAPFDVLVIPEDDGFNSTLSHGLCTAFERTPQGDEAQEMYLNVFAHPIAGRLNRGLPGANLSALDAVSLMDLCPFDTIAADEARLSPFCGLFAKDEWQSFDYYHSLGKWYGWGNGSALGPTQGVGFVNELVARLTGRPVADRTSTNTTLDASPATFPLDAALYADFSHDNSMTSIYAALGLYDATAPLSNTTRQSADDLHGYSASWTVPFGARMYVEKMTCAGARDELVRVIVNDRVVPLQNCGADALGRCKLASFIDSLGFAREGGRWEQCFV